MSLRTLPELRRPEAAGDVAFDVVPQALAAWDPNIQPTAKDDANNVISILDVIGEDFWTGEGVTSKRIAGALRAIGDQPVIAQINSPGGNFFEGLAIYNQLRAHPAKVTVQILGIAASAASIIAMAGDEIQIAKAGLMMIHNVQWVAIGDRHAMLDAHNTMKVFDDALTGLYVDRTGNVADEIGTMLDATTFMNGDTAIEKGFADGLLPADRVTKATNALDERPVAYKLEAALAKLGMPRAERRKILKEITVGTPGAAAGGDTPRAVETDVVNDGNIDLSLALARLRLATV